MSNTTFNEATAEHIERLEQFTPIVERVHGKENPEFFEVRKLFDGLNKKIKLSDVEKPALNQEFAQLREVTNNYEVPAGVCESYEAVYQMLEALDTSYYNEGK